MLVSVIITTKNEEKNIARCLRSIAAQTYPLEKLEVIVVDNNSTDGTLREIENFQKKFSLPKIAVFNQGPERSAQRNFGAKNSSGDFFLFLDADMALSRKVIEEGVERMKRDSRLAGLYIPEEVKGKGFWGKVRNFERSFYDGTVIDAVRFVRKDKFFQASGFDENLTGPEDWDFDKKIRKIGAVGLIKASLSHSEGDFDLKKYLGKKRYYSRDFQKYISKWGKDDPDIKKQFGFYYRFVGVFWEDGKWKKSLGHPFLAAGMLALRFLVGVNFLAGRIFRRR
jgi:glycosyltransferase involved in cell wall biosynthesis